MKTKIKIAKLDGCARCGKNHRNLIFRRLTRPCLKFNYWCPCPTNGQPIMNEIVGVGATYEKH